MRKCGVSGGGVGKMVLVDGFSCFCFECMYVRSIKGACSSKGYFFLIKLFADLFVVVFLF